MGGPAVAETMRIRGVLVGLEARDYDFTDSSGERRQGTTRKAGLADDAFGEPKMLKVGAALSTELAKAGFGALVEVTAQIVARNNRIERVVLDESPATVTAGAVVAAPAAAKNSPAA